MQTWHDRRAAACVAVGVYALAAIVATAVRAQARRWMCRHEDPAADDRLPRQSAAVQRADAEHP